MVKLQVLNVSDKTYTLLNIKTGQTYKFNLNFYGLKKLPQAGDFLNFSNELLDKNYIEYSESYQFGPITEVYGREVTSSEDIDVIELDLDDEKIYLKRFFG